MTDLIIRQAAALDIKPLVSRLRPDAAQALALYDTNPRQALRRVLANSPYRRTAVLDGVPVAMWGVAATLLSDAGTVWLAVSEEASKHRRLVMTTAKREMNVIISMYQEVATTILPDDEASVRFALWLGFQDSELRGSRKVLTREILRPPSNVIPFQPRPAVGMAYRAEAVS